VYTRFLSWRYLWGRRTNLIGIVGIFVGVGALILILSIMSGFLEHTREIVRGSLADIVIQPLMLRRVDGRNVPAQPDRVLEIVRADPAVEAACAQLTWYAILAQDGRDAPLTGLRLGDPENSSLAGVELVGIDPADEFETTELRRALESPSRVAAGRVDDPEHPFATPAGVEFDGLPLDSVLVGEQLAQAWFLSRGSEIELLTAVPDQDTGELRQSNLRFLVAGTFRTGENEIDLGRIYMARDALMDFLGDTRGYSQVLVKLHDYEAEGEQARARLQEELGAAGLIRGQSPYEVRTWEQFKGVLIGAIENERVLMAIMLSLVVVVAGFTIFAILSMMATEKRRDIGILTALGASPRGVLEIFLMIAFWDAVIGAALGAALGTWAAIEIDAIERGLSKLFGVQIFNRDVYIFDHIPSVVDPTAVALIVLGAFLCTLVFAAIPAFKAARLHPIDALRYE
jgi:lipoprotein-releasing system permease protein